MSALRQVRFWLAAAALPSLVVPVVQAGGVPKCLGEVATLVGTEKRDFIEGTSGPDVIVALDGPDTIFGKGGDDIICPGPQGIFAQSGGSLAITYADEGNDVVDGGPLEKESTVARETM